MIKDFLEIGKIVGTHGVRGEVRVDPWCDAPEFIKRFKTLYFDSKGEKPIKVLSCRPHGNVALLSLEGVDDVTAAAALRGRVIFMRRSDARLDKGKYFIAELFDCTVVDADDENKCYGTLVDVSQTGANDVWHISSGGREYLIPAIPQVVVETDVEKGVIRISPLKGIFDDEN